MVVKRTFATKLDPVDAFGISNELLRPRGFTLDKGTPPRSQSWRRGVEPGKKAKGIFNAAQTIELEFNCGKINVTATAGLTGRKAAKAQGMLTAYAEALERILASGEAPEVAARGPRRAESAIRREALGRKLSVCTIILAVLGGGGYAAATVKSFPSPMKWFNRTPAEGGQAEAKGKKSGSPPVVIVRRAGTHTNATKQADPSP